MNDDTWYGSGLFVAAGLLLGQMWWNPLQGFISFSVFLFIIIWLHGGPDYENNISGS